MHRGRTVVVGLLALTVSAVVHSGCATSLRSCLDTAVTSQAISKELAIRAEANYMAAGGAAEFKDRGSEVVQRTTDECTKQITIAHCFARDAGTVLTVDAKGNLPACRVLLDSPALATASATSSASAAPSLQP